MSSLTRGPLPARVYWTRRIVLLGTALLLVFGVAKVLTAGSDASSEPEKAAQVAAQPTRTALPTTTATVKQKPGKRHAPVLAAPDGPCADKDIAVTPEVTQAVAGPRGDVFIVLHLRTLESPACTWQVSHESLTLKISSGKDDIWSSRECPRVVPTRDVVVRRAVSTDVGVTWNGRRSDDDCSRSADWALPGYYHVAVAALAGEPADEQFELEAPTGKVITKSPSPSQQPGGNKGAQRNGGRPVASPSGSTD